MPRLAALAIATLLAVTGLTALISVTPVTAAATASAGNSGVLEHYLNGLHTLSTDFTQTVSDPQGKVIERGRGSLMVERPGRFRWDYQPGAGGAQGAPGGEGGQLLIGDGKNLWFYDRELAQVTVKPLSAALAPAPILLLSGSLSQLRTAFDVMDAGRREGLQWVDVRPHDSQAGFRDALLGFRDDELARMIVHDMLGQTEQLDYQHSRRNVPIDAATFVFKAPPGVDVIGTPQP
jgi:chaperone LolA